jgi:hypothetical protein
MNPKGIELIPDEALRNTPTQILHQKPHTAVLREIEGLETQTLPQSKDRSALTVAGKPLAVDETTISISFFSWFVRPLGQDARNQSRKVWGSRTPEIQFVVLLVPSSAGSQVLVIWALIVVPSGLSLRGPEMLLDIRLLAVSGETAGSDGSESMAVGLSDTEF